MVQYKDLSIIYQNLCWWTDKNSSPSLNVAFIAYNASRSVNYTEKVGNSVVNGVNFHKNLNDLSSTYSQELPH